MPSQKKGPGNRAPGPSAYGEITVADYISELPGRYRALAAGRTSLDRRRNPLSSARQVFGGEVIADVSPA